MTGVIEHNGRYTRSIEVIRNSPVPLTKREIETLAKISPFSNQRFDNLLSKYTDEIYVDNTNDDVRIRKRSTAFGLERATNIIRRDCYIKRSLIDRFQKAGYYFKFQPFEGTLKAARMLAVRSLKHPQSKEDTEISNNMIEEAVIGFSEALKFNGSKYGVESMDDINSTIVLPSKFSANSRIADCFRSHFDNPLYDAVFEKRLCEDVRYYKWWIEMEKKANTERVIKRIEDSKKAHYGEPFEVKKFGANVRRYLYNLFKFSISLHSVIDMIENKNVLLVDDTLGEGTTLREAMRLIEGFNPKNILLFTVMRDFRRN